MHASTPSQLLLHIFSSEKNTGSLLLLAVVDNALKFTKIIQTGLQEKERNSKFISYSNWESTHFLSSKWQSSKEKHKKSSINIYFIILLLSL
jgi:hypothetical protein